jgi:hypothetical protein
MHSFIFDVKSTVENPSFIHYAVQATAASVSQYIFAPNVRRAFSKLVVFAFLAFCRPPFFLRTGLHWFMLLTFGRLHGTLVPFTRGGCR